MKVAYVTTYNPNDINKWSGLGYFMYKCIADQGAEVILINSEVPHSKWLKLKDSLTHLIFGKRVESERNPAYLKKLSAKAEQQLSEVDYDVVLSPGSLPVSYLNIDKPVVFWTDATFGSMVDFYPEWNNLSKKSLREGHEAEQRAIDKASLIFYTSDWALNSAVESYHANPVKIRQIPFGPNLQSRTYFRNVEDLICDRQNKEQVNLLFVGVDWKRKGGNAAIDTVKKLREKGINAVLTVVGSNHSPAHKHPYVIFHPFIDKSLAAGVNRLNELYEEATFFLLPTTAECFGVVFAEAGSHALPVITTNVGGCSTAIKNGYNGYCLELDNFSSEAADKIFKLVKSPRLYMEYSLNAYENFKNDLNWEVVGKKVVKALKDLVNNKSFLFLAGAYKICFGLFEFCKTGIT